MTDKIELAGHEKEFEDTRAGTKEISSLRKQIETLQTQLSSKDITIHQLKTELETKMTSFKNLEKQYRVEKNSNDKNELYKQYQNFTSSELFMDFQSLAMDVIKNNSVTDVRNRSIADEFIKLGIIRRIETDNISDPFYVLTSKGEYFWKEYTSDN